MGLFSSVTPPAFFLIWRIWEGASRVLSKAFSSINEHHHGDKHKGSWFCSVMRTDPPLPPLPPCFHYLPLPTPLQMQTYEVYRLKGLLHSALQASCRRTLHQSWAPLPLLPCVWWAGWGGGGVTSEHAANMQHTHTASQTWAQTVRTVTKRPRLTDGEATGQGGETG